MKSLTALSLLTICLLVGCATTNFDPQEMADIQKTIKANHRTEKVDLTGATYELNEKLDEVTVTTEMKKDLYRDGDGCTVIQPRFQSDHLSQVNHPRGLSLVKVHWKMLLKNMGRMNFIRQIHLKHVGMNTLALHTMLKLTCQNLDSPSKKKSI